jgi:hypothetical protein
MADGVTPVVDTNLGPAPMGASGTIGIMSDLAEMRNRQNQNILFQQQMQGRHQLGEDLAVWGAQGLSPEEQIDKASHQPYAPFVTPEIANFRASNLAGAQVQQTQTAVAEAKQRMYNAGLGPIAEALSATQGDPTKLASAFKIATAGLPSDLTKSLAPAYSAMLDSVTSNLPSDPAAAHAKVQENLRNLGMTFGGLPLDKLYAMGNGIAPTYQVPKGPQGQEMPSVVSGGGDMPAVASPILGGGATPSPAGAPSSGSPIVGPTTTQGTYLGARGTDMADYQKGLDDRVKMGQQIMQTVAPAWDALQDLKKSGQSPGGLQTARMAIAQMAQGLGADPSVVDKISKLGDTQEFSKLMVNTTMSQISQQLPSMSKMAVSEYNSFTKNNPNLDTDPRAIEKIFNFWSGVQNTNRLEQTEMNSYLAKGGNISEWPAKWQEIAEKKGLVSSNPTGTGGGAKERPPIESFFK